MYNYSNIFQHVIALLFGTPYKFSKIEHTIKDHTKDVDFGFYSSEVRVKLDPCSEL